MTGIRGGSTYITPTTNTAIYSSALNGIAADVLLWRVTKAAIKVWCVGPALTASGTLIGCSFPRQGANTNGSTGGINWSNILNSPGCIMMPAASTAMGDAALEVHYSPTDEKCYNYVDPSNIPTSLAQSWTQNLGELWVMGSGLQTGESIWIECVLGLECIPASSIVQFVDSTPSFVHTNEMDQAENIAAVMPKSVKGSVNDEEFMSSESSDSTSNDLKNLPPNLKLALTRKTNLPVSLKDFDEDMSNNKSFGSVSVAPLGTGGTRFLPEVSKALKEGKEVVKDVGSVLKEVVSQISNFSQFLL
jgi:hypothetical protein